MQAYLDLTDNGTNPGGGKKKRDLERRMMADDRVLDEGALIQLGHHCSETEVQAEQAERELREFLVMQFLHEKHLGDEFTGVITGMSGSGVFVSIDRFLVEGKCPCTNCHRRQAGPIAGWSISPLAARRPARR
jgi:exoribonuclease R